MGDHANKGQKDGELAVCVDKKVKPPQQFQKGDLVRVAKDLGKSMSHFTSDCDAIVLYSYEDKYGGDNPEKYGLYLKGRGSSAWYYGNQLNLIESGQGDLLGKWEAEAAAESEQKSDLDWIFENGKDVIESPHGASIAALAKCFGLTDLWGSRGEGITYYSNAMETMNMAAPFLERNDKEGWLKHCEGVGV